jgi:hypothetical protein
VRTTTGRKKVKNKEGGGKEERKQEKKQERKSVIGKMHLLQTEVTRQSKYAQLTMRRVRAAIVAVENQSKYY